MGGGTPREQALNMSLFQPCSHTVQLPPTAECTSLHGCETCHDVLDRFFYAGLSTAVTLSRCLGSQLI